MYSESSRYNDHMYVCKNILNKMKLMLYFNDLSDDKGNSRISKRHSSEELKLITNKLLKIRNQINDEKIITTQEDNNNEIGNSSSKTTLSSHSIKENITDILTYDISDITSKSMNRKLIKTQKDNNNEIRNSTPKNQISPLKIKEKTTENNKTKITNSEREWEFDSLPYCASFMSLALTANELKDVESKVNRVYVDETQSFQEKYQILRSVFFKEEISNLNIENTCTCFSPTCWTKNLNFDSKKSLPQISVDVSPAPVLHKKKHTFGTTAFIAMPLRTYKNTDIGNKDDDDEDSIDDTIYAHKSSNTNRINYRQITQKRDNNKCLVCRHDQGSVHKFCNRPGLSSQPDEKSDTKSFLKDNRRNENKKYSQPLSITTNEEPNYSMNNRLKESLDPNVRNKKMSCEECCHEIENEILSLKNKLADSNIKNKNNNNGRYSYNYSIGRNKNNMQKYYVTPPETNIIPQCYQKENQCECGCLNQQIETGPKPNKCYCIQESSYGRFNEQKKYHANTFTPTDTTEKCTCYRFPEPKHSRKDSDTKIIKSYNNEKYGNYQFNAEVERNLEKLRARRLEAKAKIKSSTIDKCGCDYDKNETLNEFNRIPHHEPYQEKTSKENGKAKIKSSTIDKCGCDYDKNETLNEFNRIPHHELYQEKTSKENGKKGQQIIGPGRYVIKQVKKCENCAEDQELSEEDSISSGETTIVISSEEKVDIKVKKQSVLKVYKDNEEQTKSKEPDDKKTSITESKETKSATKETINTHDKHKRRFSKTKKNNATGKAARNSTENDKPSYPLETEKVDEKNGTYAWVLAYVKCLNNNVEVVNILHKSPCEPGRYLIIDDKELILFGPECGCPSENENK